MRRAGGGSESRWPAMLVVRGVILAEWSNSGAGSGLLWKIEKESESWRRGETDEKGERTLLLGKKFLLERIHAGLAFLRLKFLHYYRFAIFFC